jgi:hypothetical protein
MEATLIKILEGVLSQGGVGAALALLMLYFYRRDMKNGIGAWKEHTGLLIQTNVETAISNQKLTDAIEGLSRQLPFACPLRAEQRAAAAEEALMDR